MTTDSQLRIPEVIKRIANTPDRRLAWEFFVFFSRFEYALKRDQRYLKPGKGDAQPNWDRFASDNAASFNPSASSKLQEAVDFYLVHPPRKQLSDQGKMKWSDPQIWDERDPQLVWLLRVIRIVRNNLFHGGKFPLLPVAEPSRDHDLIANGLVILENALTLDRSVGRQFLEGLE